MNALQLKSIATYASDKNVQLYAPLLEKYMPMYGINTKLRQAAFIATIIHESASFKYTKEIASGKAYEGRKDLGNIYPGDGERFRGRSLIQVTGRTNYIEVSEALNIDFLEKPHLLEQPENAVKASCWWWKSHGCNELADTGDIKKVTRRVNGGLNGLEDRKRWYNKALEVL